MLSLPIDIEKTKGFLAAAEGEALYQYARQSAALGPCLEVGSYCGKSTVYLGLASKATDNIVYAVDHHRGSEEHQPGEEYHDADLFDPNAGLMDSFRAFRSTMREAQLENHVVPIVAASSIAAKRWSTPLGMVFIDGGHSMEAALEDYRNWSGHIASGGILAIHDIFPNPKDGGQAPYTVYQLALASGLFKQTDMIDTLGILTRR
ncbi:class I SAM-dependent methyltransferase [bacterium]|nr:class I SAM-dependent methyltransferase [bacterium]